MENAVAKRPAQPIDVVRSHLESPAFAEQIQMAMPKGEGGRRLIRGAITAMQRTPQIALCDHRSIFSSLLTCAQLGLNLDGREAHLVPFKGACTLVPDYKGLVRLAIQSGSLSHIHADVICENDVFEFNKGRVIRHVIDLRQPRGKVYAAYALATFKDGSEKAEVMAFHEIEAIRARSVNRDGAPWRLDWNEMAKKTVFKRLAKWLPLAPEAQEAIAEDDEGFTGAPEVAVTSAPAIEPRSRVSTTTTTAEGEQTALPPADPPQRTPRKRAATPAKEQTVDVPPPSQEDRNAQPPAQPPGPILAWLTKHSITMDEAVSALIEYGCSEESRRSAIKSLADFTPDEVEFITSQADAIASAIIGARGT